MNYFAITRAKFDRLDPVTFREMSGHGEIDVLVDGRFFD